MGPKERRERERDEMRVRILDAARELFATDGYEAVTMRRIAQKIEYSATALYVHFADKDSLLAALCATDFSTLASDLTRIARIKDPLERLRRIGHAYVDFGTSHPNHYRLMFMTPHPMITPDQEELDKRGNPEEDAYAFLRSIVADCVAGGHFLPVHRDIDLIAQTMWAGVHGVISLHLAKQNDPWIDWKPMKKRVTTMVNTLIAGMAAGKE